MGTAVCVKMFAEVPMIAYSGDPARVLVRSVSRGVLSPSGVQISAPSSRVGALKISRAVAIFEMRDLNEHCAELNAVRTASGWKAASSDLSAWNERGFIQRETFVEISQLVRRFVIDIVNSVAPGIIVVAPISRESAPLIAGHAAPGIVPTGLYARGADPHKKLTPDASCLASGFRV